MPRIQADDGQAKRTQGVPVPSTERTCFEANPSHLGRPCADGIGEGFRRRAHLAAPDNHTRLIEHAHRSRLERDVQTYVVLPHGSPPQGRSYCPGHCGPRDHAMYWAWAGVTGWAAVPQGDGVCAGSERVGPRHHRGTAMEHDAGIDVSLERGSVCVVDGAGRIVREAKVPSEPEALVGFFAGVGVAVTRIGLEAGPLSQWLHAGLTKAGFETVLLETRQVKAALSAMVVKTDRKDARGLAQLIRMGWFRPVHAKSMGSQEVRALLVARKQLLGRLIDVELSIRGILRGFGLKVGPVTRKGFEARIRELVTGQATLERITEAMLSARSALKAEYGRLHKAVLAIVRDDAVCSRLMTVPGVGPLVAITYKSAIDDPHRIVKSKAAGALFGLTPKKYQSGEKDVTGGITLAGDEMVRTVLYEAPTFCYRASRGSQNL